jgi:chromate transport protein ChrA
MSTIAEITKDLLVFIVVMFVLLIVLVVVISRMPDENPVKRIFNALAYRVGATLGAGVLAIPIEPIPGLDGIYDIAAPVFLLYYWFTFIRSAIIASRSAPPSRAKNDQWRR